VTSSYDAIGERYAAVKDLALSRATEIPTVEHLLGNPRGLSVLDLACGHGFYARRAKQQGAAAVVGVDLSAEMVAAARRQEDQEPLGIRYVQADAAEAHPAELGHPQGFDRVLALFLFNYADSPTALLHQTRAVARCLRPGGQLVAVVPNPAFRCGEPGSERYGFRSTLLEHHPEGNRFQVEVLVEPPFQLTTRQWSQAALGQALQAAGLNRVTWHSLTVSPEGLAEHGEAFWECYQANPPNIAITAGGRANGE
jgi:SAM-dependent methyltransferase